MSELLLYILIILQNYLVIERFYEFLHDGPYSMFFTCGNTEEHVKQGHRSHQLQGCISHRDLSHLASLAPLTKMTCSENSCYLLISHFFLPSGVTLMTKCREWPGSIDLTSFLLAQTSGPWIQGWIWSLRDSWSTACGFKR